MCDSLTERDGEFRSSQVVSFDLSDSSAVLSVQL